MTTKLTAAMLRDYPDLMVVSDVQKILHVGRTKAYALLKSGKIRSLMVGKTYRVPKTYLMDYLNS